jgi:hypothetical protein
MKIEHFSVSENIEKYLLSLSYPLSERTLRDTFKLETDKALQEFADNFRELKANFQAKTNVGTWKVV